MKKCLLLAVLALAAFGMVFTGCDNGSSDPEYRVSFDLNWYGDAAEGMGEVAAPKPVWFKAIGQSITLPQVLDSEGNIYFTENGYYVSTWYKDMSLTQSAGSAFTGEAKFTPEGSCTLYAKWERRAVTLRWDLNYPSGVSVPLEELKKCINTRPCAGTAIACPEPTAQPDGTEFAGWFDSPVNGKGNQVVSGETKVPVDGGTYYAQWKYPVKVTYLLPDGTVHATKDQKAYDAVELPEDPTLDPCFAGWFDRDGNILNAGDLIKKDAVYTAKAGYTLKINKTTGLTDGAAGVEAGSTSLAIVTEPDDHANGKYVEGYYADKDCTTKVAYNDGKLLPNIAGYTDVDGKWNGDSTKVLYAGWKEFSNIGSTLVFYIDKTNGRAAKNYKFYDADNNLLTATEDPDSNNDYGITFSGTPVKYAFYGEGKDRYYVAGKNLDTASWSFAKGDAMTEETYHKQDLQIALGGSPLHSDKNTSYRTTTYIGRGKGDTKTIMELDPLAIGFKSYVTGEYNASRASSIVTNPTIWYKLKEFNKEPNVNNGYMTDWFIPSASIRVSADGANIANNKSRDVKYSVVPVRAF